MKGKIWILPDRLIDQISAGEVVENPASVVKELVENSCDAKSSSIAVEIVGGGFQYIRVSDDGEGMSREDLSLSLKRHATSKIKRVSDLQNMHSMGFRGEALAAIAAVARISVTSSLKEGGNTLGAKLLMEGERCRGIEAAVRKGGTTVEVESLFYNVPARRKFQKSAAASRAEIVKMCVGLALAHPEIRLELLSDGKPLLSSRERGAPSPRFGEVVENVLGREFLQGGIEVNYREGPCSITGYLGSPSRTRSNRSGQFLFLNNRLAICYPVSHALYEGYGTLLNLHHHPTYVLHLTLPPQWIDVNVHPQKREVRLRETPSVKGCVRRAVIESLRKRGNTDPIRGMEIEMLEGASPPFSTSSLAFREERGEGEVPVLPLVEGFCAIGLFSPYLLLAGGDRNPHLEPCDGILFVDLEAAQARIAYERCLCGMDERGELQGLLSPITLQFPRHESEQLSLYLEEIRKVGIEIREFGKDSFLVEAIAAHLDERRVEPLLCDLVETFSMHSDPQNRMGEKKERVATVLSRHIKSRKKGWTLVEGEQLLRELLKTSAPHLCPSGKAIIAHLKREKIAKLFS